MKISDFFAKIARKIADNGQNQPISHKIQKTADKHENQRFSQSKIKRKIANDNQNL